MQLADLVNDFAASLQAVDALRPIAGGRNGRQFQPGIGPHSEAAAIELTIAEMTARWPVRYEQRLHTDVRYPSSAQRCDLCIGDGSGWDWAVELKLLRFLGDNGKPNDNMLMHILSPYPKDRSALTDCAKLTASGLARRYGIIIFGYEHDQWPLGPAIEAFELLASARVRLHDRIDSSPMSLVHPVHHTGRVVAWQVDADT